MIEYNKELDENFAETSHHSSQMYPYSNISWNNKNYPKINQTKLINLYNDYINNNNRNQNKRDIFLKTGAQQIDDYSKYMNEFLIYILNKLNNIETKFNNLFNEYSNYSKKNFEQIIIDNKQNKENSDSISNNISLNNMKLNQIDKEFNDKENFKNNPNESKINSLENVEINLENNKLKNNKETIQKNNFLNLKTNNYNLQDKKESIEELKIQHNKYNVNKKDNKPDITKIINEIEYNESYEIIIKNEILNENNNKNDENKVIEKFNLEYKINNENEKKFT